MGTLPRLADRRLRPLFWTQFLGAFNDNLFKTALVFSVTYGTLSAKLEPGTWTSLLQLLFILPFFLFSAFGGQLADKLDKARLVRALKLGELVVMIVASLGLLLDSPAILAVSLFAMGTQSAFFGPVKYGILPSLVGHDGLVRANALIGSATFVAVLMGTIGGGLLVSFDDADTVSAALLLVVAALGIRASRGVPSIRASEPGLKLDWHPLRQTLRCCRLAAADPVVRRATLGVAWFWFMGATILTILPVIGEEVLRVRASVVSLFLAMFCLGIGIGSFLCGRLARHRVELGVVPVAAAGLSVFVLDAFFTVRAFVAPGGELAGVQMFIQTPGSVRLLVDLVGLAVCGGLYSVPLNAVVQARAQTTERSRILAAGGILQALFMVISALMTLALARAGAAPFYALVGLAAMNALVVLYLVRQLPFRLARFGAWVLARIAYRLRVEGIDNVPAEGGVVLASNHVSYLDALILSAAVSRPVRFVMYHRFSKLPILGRLVDSGRVIPIAGRDEDPRMLRAALDQIASALDSGEVVCIFPEGTLTSDGEVGQFRSGIERIVRRTPVPVVPMGLRGLAGSLFSRVRTRSKWWLRVAVNVGEPIPGECVSAVVVRDRVAALV